MPLTVFQSIPLDGVVVVSTPQDLVGMIVRKAVNMANMMNIPVLGLVENMSYALCPGLRQAHRAVRQIQDRAGGRRAASAGAGAASV